MLDQKNSRRHFLKQSAVVASGTFLLPAFLKASPVSTEGRSLVIIQLSGGNDGLNTIIPYRSEVLQQLRPGLLESTRDLLKLDDEIALNPAMQGLAEIYDQGDLCILNAVGYPNPSRSHFRSMDIWHTASEADEYLSHGWLGRFLDSECEKNFPVTAVEMGNVLSTALKGANKKGVPLTNITQFYRTSLSITEEKEYDVDNPIASYLYKTQAEIKQNAAYLYEKNKVYNTKKNYPANRFGKQLKEVAEMIISGVDAPIYYVSLSGFDTHNNQKGRQARLLKTYSDAVKVFVDDLKSNNRWDETLVMTFSEFGRRVKENGSKGTDHGKANNLFIMGGKLKRQGTYNPLPDLTNLDNGDVQHQIDFRQVYSTLLNRWMDADANKILGRSFSNLAFI